MSRDARLALLVGSDVEDAGLRADEGVRHGRLGVVGGVYRGRGASSRRILTIALPPLRGRAYVQDAAYEREQEEGTMSVARVTEITSSSKKSFDDAVKEGIKRAAKTLKNVEGAWVQDQTVVVKDGKVAEYRVNMKVTFILAD